MSKCRNNIDKILKIYILKIKVIIYSYLSNRMPEETTEINETEFHQINVSLDKLLDFLLNNNNELIINKYFFKYNKLTDFVKMFNFCKKKLDEQFVIIFRYVNHHIFIKYDDSTKSKNFKINFTTKHNVWKQYNIFSRELQNYNKKYYFYNSMCLDTKYIGDDIWFNINQIEQILEYKRGNNYLKRYYGNRYNIKFFGEYVGTDGLIEILNRSRKPHSKSLMEQLELNTINKKHCIEAKSLEDIIDYLDIDKIEYKLQYMCGSYFIDMYLPKYNIVIEIDENGHADRNITEEIKREKYIKDNLTKKILRINPNSKEFKITKELGKLNKMIKI